MSWILAFSSSTGDGAIGAAMAAESMSRRTFLTDAIFDLSCSSLF